jgi:polyketide cyclase/dehydrase/lipid transport protein
MPAANEYAFITAWHVPATPDEIASVLADAKGLERWWPSVYLKVTIAEPGDDRGIGKIVDLHTKGWLPYTLKWRFRVTESDPPKGFALTAEGDFVGRGIRTIEPEAPGADGSPRTRVTYDWRISAEKAVLRRLSFVMKPLFSANHHWAMARGEESLRLEVARRRAAASGDELLLASIAAPPGPTFPTSIVQRVLRRRC